ncbi:hypothetical protein SAMN05444506_104257 [Pseudomonas syringae]|nr:hypothetical protein SAMN05444506_104257 [Pseudomonas syringae]
MAGLWLIWQYEVAFHREPQYLIETLTVNNQLANPRVHVRRSGSCFNFKKVYVRSRDNSKVDCLRLLAASLLLQRELQCTNDCTVLNCAFATPMPFYSPLSRILVKIITKFQQCLSRYKSPMGTFINLSFPAKFLGITTGWKIT